MATKIYPQVTLVPLAMGDTALTHANAIDASGGSKVKVSLPNVHTIFNNDGYISMHWLSVPDGTGSNFTQDDPFGDVIDVSAALPTDTAFHVLVPLELLQKADQNGKRAGIYYKYKTSAETAPEDIHKPSGTHDPMLKGSTFDVHITGLQLTLKAPSLPGDIKAFAKTDLDKGMLVTIPAWDGMKAGQTVQLYWNKVAIGTIITLDS
ncbi:hypothetical protein ACPRNU_25570, partial [Chromobacterium vaccinii]|uniref:hypothetical protein n=1 Tax=Chromobacterium vaccinii TaxID=1108595 RepID=UPI003C766D13